MHVDTHQGIPELDEWREERNVWGTLKSDVGEGFCRDCERPELEGHYDNCPHHPKNL